MNRFLKYTLLSNLLRRKKIVHYNICRYKHDLFETVEEISRKSSNSKTPRKSNSKLLEKIFDNKNEEIKVQMLKSYIKMNPDSKWKAIPINFLLKCKVKKNETRIKIEKHNCPEILTICCPTKEECDDSSSLQSFRRPKRGDPGEVIWGFIPKEWTTFFVPITGHSGFYTLLFTLSTYLFSKEIYVCDHEYYNGLSIIIICIYIVKKKGPFVARYLDKEIDKYEEEWNTSKDQMKQHLMNSIDLEKKGQNSIEGQLTVIQAKRENVHLQRELEYRRRQMGVYEKVKGILDYQVEVEEVRRKIQHKNLIHWVTKEVEKSLTPELQENYLKICIADIEKILKSDEAEKGKK